MNSNIKYLRRRRTIGYFINAAREIIETEGVESITLRKLSQNAGYSSATLYSYFKDLNQLITFAAIDDIISYVEEYAEGLAKCTNALEEWICEWESCCRYSFREPIIYKAVFNGDTINSLQNIRTYYTIFPEQMPELSEIARKMLFEDNSMLLDSVVLTRCSNQGFIKNEDKESLNDIMISLYLGYIYRITHECTLPHIDTLCERFMDHSRRIMKTYRID